MCHIPFLQGGDKCLSISDRLLIHNDQWHTWKESMQMKWSQDTSLHSDSPSDHGIRKNPLQINWLCAFLSFQQKIPLERLQILSTLVWEMIIFWKSQEYWNSIAQRFWDSIFQYNIFCVVYSAEEAKPAIRGPNISARLSTNAVAVLKQAMSADCQGKLSAIQRSLFTSPAGNIWDHLLASKKVAHIL